MKKITMLGNLKNVTESAVESDFNQEIVDSKSVSVEIENYYGSTMQAFLLKVINDEVQVVDCNDKYNSSILLEDYGVKAVFEGDKIIVKYLESALDLADVDGDYIFETDNDLLRLQMSNRNLYEVVIAETETRAGKIYVYAESEKEAEEMVHEDLSYYLEALNATGEMKTMDYSDEVNMVTLSEIDPEGVNTYIENDVLCRIDDIDENSESTYTKMKEKIDLMEDRNLASMLSSFLDLGFSQNKESYEFTREIKSRLGSFLNNKN